MSSAKASNRPARRPIEPLAGAAFVFACLVMVLPTQADVVASMLLQKRPAAAMAFGAFWTALILALSVGSLRRQHRQPERWRGRRTILAVLAIVVINAVLFAIQLVSFWRG